MIVYGGAAHTASAAIFHQGNKEVVVLTESGDTLTGIARDAVHTYGLANNVGRCVSALIQEVHGVSLGTYNKNPKRYDRKVQPEQTYVLPGACLNNILKGKVADTTQVPANTIHQRVVPTTVASEVPTIHYTQSATPEQVSPEFAAPEVVPQVEEVTAPPEVVPSQSQVLAYSSIPPAIPPLPRPTLNDEEYRTSQAQSIVACANAITDIQWEVLNLPDIVYTTGAELMRSIARDVCGDERKVVSLQPHNAA